MEKLIACKGSILVIFNATETNGKPLVLNWQLHIVTYEVT